MNFIEDFAETIKIYRVFSLICLPEQRKQN